MRYNICQGSHRKISAACREKSLEDEAYLQLHVLFFTLYLDKSALRKVIIIQLGFHNIVNRTHFLTHAHEFPHVEEQEAVRDRPYSACPRFLATPCSQRTALGSISSHQTSTRLHSDHLPEYVVISSKGHYSVDFVWSRQSSR